jgi:hypothetical protein
VCTTVPVPHGLAAGHTFVARHRKRGPGPGPGSEMFGTGEMPLFLSEFGSWSPWGFSVSNSQPQTITNRLSDSDHRIRIHPLQYSTPPLHREDCRSPECRRIPPAVYDDLKRMWCIGQPGVPFLPCHAAQAAWVRNP